MQERGKPDLTGTRLELWTLMEVLHLEGCQTGRSSQRKTSAEAWTQHANWGGNPGNDTLPKERPSKSLSDSRPALMRVCDMTQEYEG